ncbi:MAG: metallophosphoesterase family protein [Patescibacteria group bacterium]|nr:metallophosphoesterase family protein [Patescibacteria group bacterium]
MKLQIASDLHFEFYPNWETIVKFIDELVQPVDAIVLAGDICSFPMIPKVLRAFIDRYPVVIYVPGNHEYYEQSFHVVAETLKHTGNYFGEENCHVLNGDSVEVGGQKFLGGTLWFAPDAMNQFYERQMQDFSSITGLRKHVYQVSDEHAALFNSATPDDIIVSHHLPCELSVPARFKSSQINRFFLRSMELKGKLWIHGHTHDSCDYTVYGTRVICNPFGYYDYQVNSKFDPALVIEV